MPGYIFILPSEATGYEKITGVELNKEETCIGRIDSNFPLFENDPEWHPDIILKGEFVARNHASIIKKDEEFFLRCNSNKGLSILEESDNKIKCISVAGESEKQLKNNSIICIRADSLTAEREKRAKLWFLFFEGSFIPAPKCDNLVCRDLSLVRGDSFDAKSGILTVNGEKIKLKKTGKETKIFLLIKYLFENRGNVVNNQEIIEAIWSPYEREKKSYDETNVRTEIGRARAKIGDYEKEIGDYKNPVKEWTYILTGVKDGQSGYMFRNLSGDNS